MMAAPNKLAYVCHIFPYLTQTFVYREVEELQRAGIPLTVFSMKPAIPSLMSPESRPLMEGTVYLPRVAGAAVLLSQFAWLLRAPRAYLRALVLVARGRYRFNNTGLLWLHGLVDFARGAHLARLLQADGSFCHLYAQFADDACTTTMVAAMLAGIPFSFRSHTSPNPQLIQEKVRRVQFVVSASLYDKRVLIHWCGERVAQKIHVNRLGVPLDRYHPQTEAPASRCSTVQSPPEAEAGLPAAPPMILSVGTLIPEKGFEYVIRACRLLVDWGLTFECRIVGDGPDRAKLKELIELLELERHVVLSPYQPQEELRRLFQQAAVFTLPCIFPLNGNVDVIPLVLQEAMAMARPVVGTPVSGIPELIQDGVNGLLAPEKDHEALAEALARVLQEPALAGQLGVAARKTIEERFDIAKNGAELAAILRREVPELGIQAFRRSGIQVFGADRDGSDHGFADPEHPNTRTPERPPRAVPLRIAWVAEIPVPYRLGLYRRLRREAGLDLQLFFCSTTQKDRDWRLSLDDVPHVILRGATLAVRPREQFYLRVNPGVWRALTRFRPDVVVVGGYAHVTMQLAMLWCRWTRTPYLINSESHARGVRPKNGARRLTDALKQFFIRGAAAGLPAGTLARESLLSYGGRIDRMFLLPNTCDVSTLAERSGQARLNREAIRREMGIDSGPLLLFVGRLTPVKGLETLLRAFADLLTSPAGGTSDPRPSLLLVGDGEQRRELESLAMELRVADRLRFIGSRPWDEIPNLYGIADLLVLPSLFEPWGAVVLEAMASGLPVVVSDQVGCATDLVRPGENGWIVPAGDARALAAALRDAVADPVRLAAMGAASARLAPAWGEAACLESFLAAIHQARAPRWRTSPCANC